jgi:hypothetical protein
VDNLANTVIIQLTVLFYLIGVNQSKSKFDPQTDQTIIYRMREQFAFQTITIPLSSSSKADNTAQT